MIVDRTLSVSQKSLKDAITGIPGLMEDDETALVNREGHSKIKRTDNRVQYILQGVVNIPIGEKLNSAEFENRHLRKIEDATLYPRNATKMTEAML